MMIDKDSKYANYIELMHTKGNCTVTMGRNTVS